MIRELVLGTLLVLIGTRAQNETSAIEGVITRSTTLAPVEGAEVTAVLEGGHNILLSTRTDGSGHFAFSGIRAGRYGVLVRRDGYLVGRALDEYVSTAVDVVVGKRAAVNFTLTQAANLSGRLLDSQGNPERGTFLELLRIGYDRFGERLWTVVTLELTNDRGEYRFETLFPDEYYLRAVRGILDERPGPSANRATLYYPGSVDAAGATSIVLREGEERVADFSGHFQKGYSVTGRVSSAIPGIDGLPRTELTLLPRNGGSPAEAMGRRSLIELRAGSDGRFQITDVTPGFYDLTAIARIPGAAGNEVIYVSTTAIQIKDQDAEAPALTLLPGVEVTGRLIADAQGQSLRLSGAIRGLSLEQVQNSLSLTLMRRDGLGGIFRAVVDDAGTSYKFSNVPPGAYVISANPMMMSTAYLSEVLSRNAHEGGLLVGNETVFADLAVNSDGGTIEGTVRDGRDNNVHLVLVPAAQYRNKPFAYKTAALVTSSGSFKMTGIPPGNYTLFARDAEDTSQPFMNADYVARHANRGVLVSVQKNSTTMGIVVEITRTHQ
jgi:hypothetical protein